MSPHASSTILIVDDNEGVRETVHSGLRAIGYATILRATDGDEAKTLLESRDDIDLVITDLSMPRMDGLHLMRWATTERPGPVWIILSGVDTFAAAVEAIRVGAFDFLPKPVTLEKLEVAIRNGLAHRHLERERQRLFAELEATNRDLAGKVQELEQKSERIRRDMERAEVIQRALLPALPPDLGEWTANALHRPGRHVGGDLYNVVRIGVDHAAFYVADATGHGISSAMLSVLFHRRLRLTNESGRPLPPAVVLEQVNRGLAESRLSPGLFVTVGYALLDLQRGELQYAGAGHPPALLHRRNGEQERLYRTGPAIGLVSTAKYTQQRLQLERGDRLLMLTDGILGVPNGDTLSDVAAALASQLAGKTLLAQLGGRVPESTPNGDERDDLTLLLIEATLGESHFDNGVALSDSGALKAPAMKEPVLWYGEQAQEPNARDRRWLALRGRGTWIACDLFHETVVGLLDEGYDVAIDLSDCSYLDSTCLGTLHELIGRADTGEGPRITLHGVSEPLHAAFEELNMERVLEAITEDCAPPGLQPLSPGHAPTDMRERVLRAHEELASLSARNREKFLAVVESIRSQMQ